MTFKPVDYSEEKENLNKNIKTTRSGEEAKTEETIMFKKHVETIEEFIDAVITGFSPFRGGPPVQRSTLLCLKVLDNMKLLKSVNRKQLDIFLESVQQDLGEPVRKHIKLKIFKDTK